MGTLPTYFAPVSDVPPPEPFATGTLDAGDGDRAWPGSELIVVEDEGHGGEEMVAHWRRILAELA